MSKLQDKDIIKALLDGGYITQKDIEIGEEYVSKNNGTLLEYFLMSQLIDNDILGQAVAEFLGVSYFDLNSIQPSKAVVLKIPESTARKLRVLIFKEDNKNVFISTDDPLNLKIKENLKKIFTDKKIVIGYSLSEDIDNSFLYYRKSLDTRFQKIIESGGKIAPEIINAIIEDALMYKASDIHFEPNEENVMIRFRVDGVLQQVGDISRDYYNNILNRVKVLANLRIDEHSSVQDGAIHFFREDKPVDTRISITPTINGEKIVIRILSSYIRALTLYDLGLQKDDQDILEKAAKKPFGMVVVVGPTGSGKSTTLYALLRNINNPEVNITTIEDPVEYRLKGANQIQVNKKANITFAQGLRSIARQDPDIILVGEIRDHETADIAVNAALTGHLLFSTFHANDAATTIPRLLDMGVEPFLLSSTLELVVAQRLVRKICPNCRYSYTETKTNLKKVISGINKYLSKASVNLYKGKGCDSCGHTGYSGRIAIFEFIVMTTEMKELILKNPSASQINELAKKHGMRSMFADGMEKVKSGVTTLDELLRVVAAD